MRSIDAQTVLKITGAETLSLVESNFSGIGTDTRLSLQGQLFIALKGEAFDGHNFIEKALSQGASGVLLHQDIPELDKIKSKVTIFKVGDTLKALQQLATFTRLESKAKVIGITGSNGKTTTKEFSAALLKSVFDVHFSAGSFNNHWGVPFTLLQLGPEKDMAIVEMGMNHAGEITDLVQIAQPDIVLCTMVGRAHIEFFGTIEKIAAAKEEIYEAASENALRIYNLDNSFTRDMYKRALQKYSRQRLLTFSSEDSEANVHLQISESGLKEISLRGTIGGVKGSVRVPVFGAQNLTNLMAAASVGLAVGMKPEEIWSGLSQCKTNWGRNQLVELKSGAQMIFDAYNANPDSMKALIENVKSMSIHGRKIGVFGQMRELGSLSEALHEELGQRVGSSDFDRLYFVGDDSEAFSKGLKAAGYLNPSVVRKEFSDELGADLAGYLRQNDLVVVKASRGTRLERFVYPCEPLNFQPKQ